MNVWEFQYLRTLRLYFRICDVDDIRREWFGGEDQAAQTATAGDEEVPDRAEEKEEGNLKTTGAAAQEKARGELLSDCGCTGRWKKAKPSLQCTPSPLYICFTMLYVCSVYTQ